MKEFVGNTKEDKENEGDDKDKFIGVTVGRRLKYDMLDEKKVCLGSLCLTSGIFVVLCSLNLL